MLIQHNFEVNKPSRDEKKIAKNSVALLKDINLDKKTPISLMVGNKNIELPPSALKLLVEALRQLSKGNALTLIPRHASLTTQEAADLLNVSRPFLISLLESGEIPFTKVGNRRKVLANDLFSYKKKSEEEQKKAIDDLVAQAEDLKMGY